MDIQQALNTTRKLLSGLVIMLIQTNDYKLK